MTSYCIFLLCRIQWLAVWQQQIRRAGQQTNSHLCNSGQLPQHEAPGQSEDYLERSVWPPTVSCCKSFCCLYCHNVKPVNVVVRHCHHNHLLSFRPQQYLTLTLQLQECNICITTCNTHKTLIKESDTHFVHILKMLYNNPILISVKCDDRF